MRTGLLSAVPYEVGVVAMAFVAHISDNIQRRAQLVWQSLLAGGLLLLGSFLAVDRNFPLAFLSMVIAGGCIHSPHGPLIAIIQERLPRSVTAQALALINGAGALGSFIRILWTLTGNSRAGLLLMSISLLVAASFSCSISPKAMTPRALQTEAAR